MGKRGFTLVEVMIASTLGLAVFGLSALIYAFAVTRTSNAMASAAVLTQADQLIDTVVRTVHDSVKAETISYNLKVGLKCYLPLDGTDSDGDGQLDTYLPYRVNGVGPCYRIGRRVWYYFSDESGDFTHDGDYLFRATRLDDALPTASDVDTNWTLYYGQSGLRRFALVDSILWTADPDNQLVVFTVDLSKQLRSELRAEVGADESASRRLRITAKAYWRNWRT